MSHRALRLLSPAALSLVSILFSGCAGSSSSSSNPTNTPTSSAFHAAGSVHGGQQPIVGASVALYAAGKTSLYAAPSPLLMTPVTTLTDGSFSISNDYTCQPGDLVYLVATGGNAGGSGGNNATQLMATVGPCSTLGPSTFISINELSTVASVFSLAPYMQSATALGANTATPLGADGLAAAFATAQTFADLTTGSALETTTGNGLVPQTTVHSLANSLAACVNSTTGSQICSSLFTAAGIPSTGSATTLQAALNIAQGGSYNAQAVYQLAATSPPYLPTLSAAPTSYAIAVAHPSDVLTYHNDLARDGVQSSETTLTPTNVNSSSFGKLFTFAVDSYQFAQPLYMGGVPWPDNSVRDVVFASTTRGSVYAFDADGNNPQSGSLWHVNLIPQGERYPVSADYGNCPNPPEAGIVGTPVLDRASGTLYVVVKSISTTGSVFTHRLHALSILDGTEQPNSPTIINPTFATNGSGAGASGTTLPFDGQSQDQRSALALVPNASGGKTVWIEYASHCDIGPYHGDVLGYNAGNVSQLTAAFNDTPNGSDGGIWQGAGTLAADSSGNLYTLIGNGTFDANTSGPDYGESAIKLAPNGSSNAYAALTVASSFTPYNQADLSNGDKDTGGAEPILIQDPATQGQDIVASDKAGNIYLLNAASLGGYQTGSGGGNGNLQTWQASSGEFLYNFAYFNSTLYTSNPLSAYSFNLASGGNTLFNTTATVATSLSQLAPVVSASGSSNGVIWAQDQSGILHAFNPSLQELYNSNQAGTRDTAPTFVKFTSPVIANGKVYLSGQGALAVYGLLH